MAATEMAIVPTAERGEARSTATSSITNADERSRVRLPTGTSLAVRNVIGLIRQVAEHDSTVLILGESGTGKEVAARAVHDLSPRRQRPFIAVNCGAIPAELLESELFGHERGAFTGAVSARKGRFEISEGGTLFLDEIGDMSPSMQVKLLRVLQERVFERVGNHVPMRCNVRIIAATHRNLEESIVRGTFREDLFHRLNVFPIEMPALRARIEDLPLLVRDFIAHNIAEGRGHVQLTPRSLAALSLHRWPGNVRELGNLIERLSIVRGGRTAEVGDLPMKYRPTDWSPETDKSFCVSEELPLAEDLPAIDELSEFITDEQASAIVEPAAAQTLDAGAPGATRAMNHHSFLPDDGLDLRAHLLAIERSLITQALHRTGGTVAHAARLLHLRRTTLVEKLRKLGMLSGDVATED